MPGTAAFLSGPISEDDTTVEDYDVAELELDFDGEAQDTAERMLDQLLGFEEIAIEESEDEEI